MKDEGGQAGRTVFETLLITALSGILLVIAISTFLGSVRLAKEVALRCELGNIRTAVSLYQMLNRHYPKNLRDLVKKRYILPYQEEVVIKRQYLETTSADIDGNPLDPFGNPFVYDERSGRVGSSTKKYEGW